MVQAEESGRDPDEMTGSNDRSPSQVDLTRTAESPEKRENTQVLLKRAQDGSNAVWQVFFDRYRDFLIYNIRIKMPVFARRQFDAEDILQNAFTAAWKNILKFEYRGEGSFRVYLRKIVLNHFLNEIKKAESQGRHFSTSEGPLPEMSGSETKMIQADPASIYSQEEFLEHALDKLASMSEEDQELLGMRFYESMTWTDMGEVLSCDRETARDRFLRALRRLQRAVDEGRKE